MAKPAMAAAPYARPNGCRRSCDRRGAVTFEIPFSVRSPHERRALQLIANIRRYVALRKERRTTREAIERLKDVAAARAGRHFEATRGRAAMGGHVLAVGPEEIVVRVMYFTDHIPPDRAWFA